MNKGPKPESILPTKDIFRQLAEKIQSEDLSLSKYQKRLAHYQSELQNFEQRLSAEKEPESLILARQALDEQIKSLQSLIGSIKIKYDKFEPTEKGIKQYCTVSEKFLFQSILKNIESIKSAQIEPLIANFMKPFAPERALIDGKIEKYTQKIEKRIDHLNLNSQDILKQKLRDDIKSLSEIANRLMNDIVFVENSPESECVIKEQWNIFKEVCLQITDVTLLENIQKILKEKQAFSDYQIILENEDITLFGTMSVSQIGVAKNKTEELIGKKRKTVELREQLNGIIKAILNPQSPTDNQGNNSTDTIPTFEQNEKVRENSNNHIALEPPTVTQRGSGFHFAFDKFKTEKFQSLKNRLANLRIGGGNRRDSMQDNTPIPPKSEKRRKSTTTNTR